MTTEKVRWTSHQRELVIAGILSLLKDGSPVVLHKDERFPSSTIKPLVERAQFVLPEASRKPSFSFKFLVDLTQDVSNAWHKLQLEEATREALLSTVSVDRLISELASRQIDKVTDTVYERVKAELFLRFNERLAKVEEVLGLAPKVMIPVHVRAERLPLFALVGFLPDQIRSLTEEFNNRVVFKAVKDVGPAELKSAVTGRVTLVSSFCSHATWNIVKDHASEAHFVRHIRDIKPLIRAALT